MAYQIAGLLEKMSSVDKDYRFMATNDLIAELQNESIKLDDESERKVLPRYISMFCSVFFICDKVLEAENILAPKRNRKVT